jgi:hypothetical protein
MLAPVFSSVCRVSYFHRKVFGIESVKNSVFGPNPCEIVKLQTCRLLHFLN